MLHRQTQRDKSFSNVSSLETASYICVRFTEEQVNELSNEEVDKLFSNYEAKLSRQMIKSLGKSIIIIKAVTSCSTHKIDQQETDG